jgi:hypothetical protein
MKQVSVASLSVFVLCFLFLGCSQKESKTESMLRFEAVQAEQQALVSKAMAALDEVGDAPIVNIGQLRYAQELFFQAAQVYERENISGVDQPNLTKLQTRLNSFKPVLAKHSVALLREVANKTKDLQAQLYELKSQSYAANQNLSGENLASHLGLEYNRQIQDCCVVLLNQIQPFLSYGDDGNNSDGMKARFKQLRWLIHNVEVHQEQILAGDYDIEEYLSQIEREALNIFQG